MRQLTITQLELVVLVANGYKAEQIAEETHRSSSSVNKTLTAARNRMGANTLAHLVSLTIASGALVWTDDDRRAVCAPSPQND